MVIRLRKTIVTRRRDQDGYELTGLGDTLINSSKVETFGKFADGIRGAADGLTVRNEGVIRTHGDGAAAIVLVGDDATVINNGQIVTEGSYTPRGPQPDLFPDAINVTGDRFTLKNNGTITVGAADGSSLVVSAILGTGDGGSVTNGGSIVATSSFGSTVGIDGAGGTVTNHGSITVVGNDNEALFATGADDVVLNDGRIELVGDINSALALSGDGSEMINEGVVSVRGGYAAGMFGFANALIVRNAGSVLIDSTPVGEGSFGSAGGIQVFGEGNHAENTGSITTKGDFALGIFASRGSATLVNAGTITTAGAYSIGMAHGVDFTDYLATKIGTVENSGTIRTTGDGAVGVLLVGHAGDFTNSGSIHTSGGTAEGGALGTLEAAGVLVSGNNISVLNEVGGAIVSEQGPAVSLNVLEEGGRRAAETQSRLTNDGLIFGVQAVVGGDGAETVINRGLIDGQVSLGGGDDIFINGEQSRLNGGLATGAGSDLVILRNDAGRLDILDFEAEPAAGDVLDVKAFGFGDLDDVLAASRQVGADVFLSARGHDIAILRGVDLNALNADDFVFADPGP